MLEIFLKAYIEVLKIHIGTKTIDRNWNFHTFTEDVYEKLFDVFHLLAERMEDIEKWEYTIEDCEESKQKIYDIIEQIKDKVELEKNNYTTGYRKLSEDLIDNLEWLCSPEFFDELVKQASVKEAYKFYSSTQEPLRNGLRDGRYAKFEHGNVTFYRYIGSYKDANGVSQKLIPQNEAYFLPVGTMDTFITYFAPANKLEYVNTLGEKNYVFTYTDPKGAKVDIESEQKK